jgi:sialidase-1
MNSLLKLLLASLLALAASASDPIRQELFRSGADGYAHYRIPGLIVTAKGSLLAYAEARKTLRGDWGTIDIVLRRSTDGGRTWSPMKVIAQVDGPKTKNPVAMAQNLASSEEVTYNNPVAIADRQPGVVHFLFCLEYMRAFYLRSDDDGQSFSPAREITSTFDQFRKDYDWKVLATGPGHGIQLRNGRLLVPVWLSLGTGGHAHRPSVTATIYSDDGGKTWHRSEIAVPNTTEFINPNETAAAQLTDGTVLLNVRTESKPNRRVLVTSRDGATGWSKPVFEDSLVEPICFGSMLSLGKKRLLYIGPDNLSRQSGKAEPGSSRDRRNLTIHFSNNDGKSWQGKRVVEPGWSGYSDISASGKAIHVLFEMGVKDASSFRVESLVFESFPFSPQAFRIN